VYNKFVNAYSSRMTADTKEMKTHTDKIKRDAFYTQRYTEDKQP